MNTKAAMVTSTCPNCFVILPSTGRCDGCDYQAQSLSYETQFARGAGQSTEKASFEERMADYIHFVETHNGKMPSRYGQNGQNANPEELTLNRFRDIVTQNARLYGGEWAHQRKILETKIKSVANPKEYARRTRTFV